ncbi:Serine/arginine repetitive matrix protein 1 [Trichinella pseudospiralis]|uniref:Serine/arginine repetitive matrix protein 1 n=1 Tax=Trichinella pseudospiralis TaxID=6337 RepID=A0A0V0Y1E0_TRIPS|nr:Serine/arginine repetitive matrix protein 1 [Trichinella pseudospiralis]
MADAGFFRGTNSEQDLRFSNKQKKLLKTLKFEDSLNTKVDMKRIDLDVMRLWITKRVSEILGIEDDVVVEFVLNQLEEEDLDPRNMQINLTGFLNAKKAREFMGELWDLLIDAQSSDCGIPQTLINAKAEYLRSLSVERLATLDDPPSPELKNDSPPACVEAEERPIRDCDSPGKVSPSKTREPRHKEREQRFRRRQIHSARRSIVREQRTPAANESKADGRRRNEEPIVQVDEKCKKIDAMEKIVILDTLALINQKRSMINRLTNNGQWKSALKEADVVEVGAKNEMKNMFVEKGKVLFVLNAITILRIDIPEEGSTDLEEHQRRKILQHRTKSAEADDVCIITDTGAEEIEV